MFYVFMAVSWYVCVQIYNTVLTFPFYAHSDVILSVIITITIPEEERDKERLGLIRHSSYVLL